MPDMFHCLVHLVSKDDMLPDMIHQLVRLFSKVDSLDRFHHKVTNCWVGGSPATVESLGVGMAVGGPKNGSSKLA
jgi:hypothetical protein